MKENITSTLMSIIQTNEFLEDGLNNGYINLTGFAFYVAPVLKQRIGRDISIDSIKMSLSRIVKKVPKVQKIRRFHPNDIFIKRDISVIVIENTDKTDNAIFKLQRQKNKFMTRIAGNKKVSLVYDNFYQTEIDKILETSQDNLVFQKQDLILVGVEAWDGFEKTPGILYKLSKNMFFMGVNIIQFIQTGNEIGFVLDKKDLFKAVEAISFN